MANQEIGKNLIFGRIIKTGSTLSDVWFNTKFRSNMFEIEFSLFLNKQTNQYFNVVNVVVVVVNVVNVFNVVNVVNVDVVVVNEEVVIVFAVIDVDMQFSCCIYCYC